MSVEKNEQGEKIFITKDKRTFKLEKHEEPCRYGCETVVDIRSGDGMEGHCGMCCDEAVSFRGMRVKTLHEEAKAKAEEEGKAREERTKAREEAAKESRINEMAEAMRRSK